MLTPAEWRVMELVRHGLTNRAIAARMGTSADAVKFHVANILVKLGLPSRMELRHWTGIRRGAALGRQSHDPEKEVRMGPIGQISRQVRDIAAARRWYGEVLGLPHLYSFGDLAFFDCGGVRLFLSQSEQAGDGESILYFRVDDIRQSHAVLAGAGAEFLNAPHMVHRHEDGTEEWMAFFKDNEGRPLALMAQVRSGPA
ncbi:LuxR C-terminal-related transcriptional regulator [Sphingomonas sp. CGMCC 1.13658]|uniref:LuxR C-terminal-related transcriptional regulator n=1 Tax=Sphingomonas sp. CGMCC 1.13658 TaxID=2755554 RepID=UPI0015EC2894|nr:LuxR C-terminal-related transcriptional regulator [Sphingomonas sp. CGMCC 1.13658]MBA2919569.1 VOC family protein [Sphingomonas sp. CGMCC 1.13658]